jgi:cation diffusion facilitator CzcD-associated flavoprotein CzcO
VLPRLVRRAGRDIVEVHFAFETSVGDCRGVARLFDDENPDADAEFKAWTVMTCLRGLSGRGGDGSGAGAEHYGRDFAAPNWLDRRQEEATYVDREPAVVVVGAGQAGLGVASWLKQLGVDTLVIDRGPRVGDTWRNRYHALVLHNEIWANHLPFMPFPETWPVYIPKDLLADWFEGYATFMELNVWTGTEFLGGSYDESDQSWRVSVRRSDGSERVLRPRHVVMATGVSGIPVMPPLPGLNQFAGDVLHSGTYERPQEGWHHVLVVGTGTSGHDVAQDLVSRGVAVSLVQHTPTTVVSVGPDAAGTVYGIYREGVSTDVADLVNIATPYPVLRHTFQHITRDLAVRDREILAGLARIGFRIDFGEDETGFQMKYLRTGGGYYLDVGCAQLLIDGAIPLIQSGTITTFTEDGVVLEDGKSEIFDAVILATGYKGQEELVRRMFGDGVAQNVGSIWGFDDEGELRNMWRRTGQEGLWFTAGSLAQCRIFSRYLALQIAACETGALSAADPKSGLRGCLRPEDLNDVSPLASSWHAESGDEGSQQ